MQQSHCVDARRKHRDSFIEDDEHGLYTRITFGAGTAAFCTASLITNAQELLSGEQTLCPSRNKTAMSACTSPDHSHSTGPAGIGSKLTSLGDHLAVGSSSAWWRHMPEAWRRAKRFCAGAVHGLLCTVTHTRQENGSFSEPCEHGRCSHEGEISA
jgi:hypothetical protein